MQIEHLTKAQIVLLTLFVSFVSSMATGIVVVTLMQQTPEPVLQTITRVVEKTIEKATPTVVEKPGKQVIVKDEDLMVAAIDHNIKGVISLRIAGVDGEARIAGVGTIISPEGIVITDRKNFGGGVLTANIDGVSYALQAVSTSKDSPLALGKLLSAAASTTPAKFPVAFLGESDTLKVGQTAVVIGGRDGKTIATGVVTNLEMGSSVNKETSVTTKFLKFFGLSQRLSGYSNGAPIISLSGSIIGFVSIDEVTDAQVGVPVAEAKRILAIPFSLAPQAVEPEKMQANVLIQ